MAINKSCPLDFKKVDKNIIRLNALIIFSLLLLFVLTGSTVILMIVLIDFIIRVFFGLKYSPFCFCIKRLLHLTGIKPHKINAGSKKFAAKIGLIFSLMITVFMLLNMPVATKIIAVIFLIASGMDVFFDFCIACKLYPYYRHFIKRKKEGKLEVGSRNEVEIPQSET